MEKGCLLIDMSIPTEGNTSIKVTEERPEHREGNYRRNIQNRQGKIQSNLCTTVTLGKWQGDRYIQGDH